GAGVAPNTCERLTAWISEPHEHKRGDVKPASELSDEVMAAAVAYLEGLECALLRIRDLQRRRPLSTSRVPTPSWTGCGPTRRVSGVSSPPCRTTRSVPG